MPRERSCGKPPETASCAVRELLDVTKPQDHGTGEPQPPRAQLRGRARRTPSGAGQQFTGASKCRYTACPQSSLSVVSESWPAAMYCPLQDPQRSSRTGAHLLKHTVTPEVTAAAIEALGPDQLEAGLAILQLRCGLLSPPAALRWWLSVREGSCTGPSGPARLRWSVPSVCGHLLPRAGAACAAAGTRPAFACNAAAPPWRRAHPFNPPLSPPCPTQAA